jgi:hypothetical protein
MVENMRPGASRLQPFYDGGKHPAHLALERGGRTLCGLLAERPTDLATFSDEPCADCAAAALAGGVKAVTFGGTAVSLQRVVARESG